MFKKALIIMLAAEAASLLAFNVSAIQLPLLAAAAIGVFVLAYKRPEWGIYVLFGELFFGSRGRLLEYDFISLRMVIFSAVLISWLIRGIGNHELGIRVFKSIIHNSKFLILYGLTLTIIGLGVIIGILRGNGIINVFNDANGYLYLLILPAVLYAVRDKKILENIFKILGAAIVIIALKTFGLFVWFTFGMPGVATAYHWVISNEIGEITGHVGSASRIFMQSQFYALLGLFVFSLPLMSLRANSDSRGNPNKIALPATPRNDRILNWLIISAVLLSIIMSLSRSFWLGAIAGGLFALAVVLWKFRPYFKNFLILGLKFGLIAALEIGLLFGITFFGGANISETVASRGGNPAQEAAGGARLLLLPELLNEIGEAPVLGKGFGEEVTYKSYLPDRITDDNPDGEITSFAFEWGYLDILLKVGMIGLLVYLLFIFRIFFLGYKNFQFSISKFQTNPQLPTPNFQILGLLSGLVALAALNITTPYLNHPLGIGYLIFVYSYFIRTS